MQTAYNFVVDKCRQGEHGRGAVTSWLSASAQCLVQNGDVQASTIRQQQRKLLELATSSPLAAMQLHDLDCVSWWRRRSTRLSSEQTLQRSANKPLVEPARAPLPPSDSHSLSRTASASRLLLVQLTQEDATCPTSLLLLQASVSHCDSPRSLLLP